jgi:hypothetical protein
VLNTHPLSPSASSQVVRHFIEDYEKNGAYTGFPCLGIEWQKLENPDLRKVLNMGVSGRVCGRRAKVLKGVRGRVLPHLKRPQDTSSTPHTPCFVRALFLQAGQKGVMIRRVEPTSEASKYLAPGVCVCVCVCVRERERIRERERVH